MAVVSGLSLPVLYDVIQRSMSLFRRSEVTGALYALIKTWDGIKKRFKHLFPANLWGSDMQWLHLNSRGRHCSHFWTSKASLLSAIQNLLNVKTKKKKKSRFWSSRTGFISWCWFHDLFCTVHVLPGESHQQNWSFKDLMGWRLTSALGPVWDQLVSTSKSLLTFQSSWSALAHLNYVEISFVCFIFNYFSWQMSQKLPVRTIMILKSFQCFLGDDETCSLLFYSI